ncbi:MAG: tetratricopeptide repeat protein [Pelagimonas sp.]|uniref:tetratricopeptide repeat protein n=1 Tax=Pelagimonas sp. TaxID=2073170 RepID=UPI003D6B5760
MLSFEDFETYVPNPKTLDIRPHLKPQLIRCIENMPDAGSIMFGPEYHIFQQAIKLADFREKTANTTDTTARKDDPAKIYKDRLKALDRSTPSARGDYKLAKVLLYWLFREIREPSYFREVARLIWPNTSLIFARFIYAKCGGQPEDTFEEVSERFNAPGETVRCEFEKIWAAERAPFEVGLPSKVDQIYHYTDTTIEVLGREEEFSALVNFRDAGAGFRWWQIAGPGGQGKSRLALNLVTKTLESYPEWNAGFFLPHDGDAELRKFSEISHAWTPEKNHLFVVDYVLTRTEYLRKVMKDLSARARDFQYAVCLLIVERQPWHYGGFGNNENDCADWYAKISEHRCGKNEAFDSCRYTPDEESNYSHCLELPALKQVHLIEIVERVANLVATPVERSKKQIGRRLQKIDCQGRPLFAFFLGKALREGEYRATRNANDLLNWVLWTDRRKRWKAAEFEGAQEAPGIGSMAPNRRGYSGQNPSMHIAILAAVVGHLDCNLLLKFYSKFEWTPHNRHILREAIVFSDNNLADDPEPVITGLQPNILGEFFVLESIRRQGAFQVIFEIAWKIAPQETAKFLRQLFEDFPDHPKSTHLLKVPADPVSKKSYHSLSPIIFEAYAQAGLKSMDQNVYDLAYSAAREGYGSVHAFDAKAKLNAVIGRKKQIVRDIFIGNLTNFTKRALKDSDNLDGDFLLEIAVLNVANKKPIGDLNSGVKLIERLSKLGSPVAIQILGVLKFHGFIKSADHGEAFRAFDTAISLGQSSSKSFIGVCHFIGKGCVESRKDAVAFFESAADEGDPYGCANLALLKLYQSGTTRDLEEASRLFEAAAENGLNTARFVHGFFLLKGVFFEKDKAVGLSKIDEFFQYFFDDNFNSRLKIIALKSLIILSVRIFPKRFLSEATIPFLFFPQVPTSLDLIFL